MAAQTGSATITAASGGVSGTVTVTGTAATVASITVSPASVTLAAGQTQQYAATATLSDTSSCRFLGPGSLQRMLGIPILAGPGQVPVERQERTDGVMLRASHDGYADRFGALHERTLLLSADGTRLDGEDAFLPARGKALPASKDDTFAIRFHLHPAVKASRLSDGHGVMLILANRQAWTFTAYDDEVQVEESVYLAGPDGPRRATQIVIHGHARKTPHVHWAFAQAERPQGQRRDADSEPRLPL